MTFNPNLWFYNCIYFEKLQVTPPFEEYLKEEKAKIENSRITGRVLEIGCGTGRVTCLLSKMAEKLYAIDFSQKMVAKTKYAVLDAGLKNVSVYLEDAQMMHFEDSYFDFIVMTWNTFGNLYSSQHSVLKECTRVLNKNGTILMSVLSEKSLNSYLKFLKANRLHWNHYDDNYVFLEEGLVSERFSPKKIKKICYQARLEAKIEPLTEVAYWCTIKSKD